MRSVVILIALPTAPKLVVENEIPYFGNLRSGFCHWLRSGHGAELLNLGAWPTALFVMSALTVMQLHTAQLLCDRSSNKINSHTKLTTKIEMIYAYIHKNRKAFSR